MARPDFPISLRAFQLAFPDEAACARYLTACRWPEGFRCPRCGNNRAYLLTSHSRWQCASPRCRHQTSLTSGTILERSKVPLTTWFWAAYLVTTDKRGVSASHVERQLDLSYDAAWLLLHKLRRAMVVRDREKLSGTIEMDETWVGGPQASSGELPTGRRRARDRSHVDRRDRSRPAWRLAAQELVRRIEQELGRRALQQPVGGVDRCDRGHARIGTSSACRSRYRAARARLALSDDGQTSPLAEW